MVPGPHPHFSGSAVLQPSASLSPSLSLLLCLSISLSLTSPFPWFLSASVSGFIPTWLHLYPLLNQELSSAPFLVSTTVVFVVQLLSHLQLFVTPWTAARQALQSFTISRSLLKLVSIESVIPSNHLILHCPLLLLPSIFPSIRVFSNESALHITWPKYWSFSFSISPSNGYSGLTSFRID